MPRSVPPKGSLRGSVPRRSRFWCRPRRTACLFALLWLKPSVVLTCIFFKNLHEIKPKAPRFGCVSTASFTQGYSLSLPEEQPCCRPRVCPVIFPVLFPGSIPPLGWWVPSAVTCPSRLAACFFLSEGRARQKKKRSVRRKTHTLYAQIRSQFLPRPADRGFLFFCPEFSRRMPRHLIRCPVIPLPVNFRICFPEHTPHFVFFAFRAPWHYPSDNTSHRRPACCPRPWP